MDIGNEIKKIQAGSILEIVVHLALGLSKDEKTDEQIERTLV